MRWDGGGVYILIMERGEGRCCRNYDAREKHREGSIGRGDVGREYGMTRENVMRLREASLSSDRAGD